MYIVIVTEALENGDPLVLENDQTEMPETFNRIADIEDLKSATGRGRSGGSL